MLTLERQYWLGDTRRLAGLDEAGRGPLAGPVVAAAVILPRAWAEAEEHGVLEGLTDSKQLSEARREHFAALLRAAPGVEIGVGQADVGEIDRLNILRATHLAMARAVQQLRPLPDLVLVDGLAVQGLPCASVPIVGGDAKSLSIAAGSIIAKTVRDAMLRDLGAAYPAYGFAEHKGYGTAAHMRALYEHGPCPAHRRSFAPVKEALANRAGRREER